MRASISSWLIPNSATKVIQTVLAVTIVVLLAAAGRVSVLVLERQDTLAQVSRYNVSFSASQGVTEYMRLRQRLGSLVLRPGVKEVKDDAELRFEILMNRVNLFRGGEFGEFVSDSQERRDAVDRIVVSLAQLEHLMKNLDDGGSVTEALKLLSPLDVDFIGLASEANSYGGNAAAADQKQLFDLHWTFTSVTVLIAACGLVLFGMNRWQNRLLAAARRSLAGANSELAGQNVLFESALNNMSHGLCMFDSSGRLIVSNRRMAEIYGLPPEKVTPGTSMAQLSTTMVEAGATAPDEDLEIRQKQEMLNADKKSDTMLQRLQDGRTVLVSHQPMDSGGWTATYEDITERYKAQAQVAHMAKHDALTGLPNRVLLRESLEATLDDDIRKKSYTAVMCIDLDNFKNINDTHGHPFGDMLLCEVARRIRAVFRITDTVSRVGGDEFIIVYGGLPDSECLDGMAVRLIQALSEPYRIGNRQVLSGASVGIALTRMGEQDADDLLKNADLALYRAKAAGRGTFSFYKADMSMQMQRRSRIETGLLAADFDEQFQLAYQPITDLETGTVIAVEALLRWKRDQPDPVSPQEVISIAEDTGIIVELGAWVMKKACEQAARMPEHIGMAVNLSPVQFRRGDIVGTVSKALLETGLVPARLNLEITETLLLDDSKEILADLAKLRELGARISLDDFGTGYSSLSYLRKFSVDKIKIDRMFIQEISNNRDHRAIVQTIINMAEALGMKTVAEGVETMDQMRVLHTAGCDEVQGYLYSKALLPDALSLYLEDRTMEHPKSGGMPAETKLH